MHPETIKVMPWGEGQGDYVEINAEDFDPAKHKHFPAHPLDHDADGRKGGSKPRKKGTAE